MIKVIFDSTKNADLLYRAKAQVHDPVFLIDYGDRCKIYLDSREAGVFKEENQEIEVVLLDPILSDLAAAQDSLSFRERLALFVFEANGLLNEEVGVPISFPLDLADFLRSKGAKLLPLASFYPERIAKNEGEIRHIEDALAKTTSAYRKVEEILSEAGISSNGTLEYYGVPLTSEYLKQVIDMTLLEQGLLNVEGLIVSSGPHAAIPHHLGKGPIKAHETIIIDIFPRDRSTGYFADMTRTYVKGGASPEQQKMYEAVLRVQEMAIALIKPGVDAKSIYQACVDEFIALGFHAEGVGFIHGTGHGLGLDIHEEPYINIKSQGNLEKGAVVTVEPGLYYPEWGGVRIEDVVVVTEDGCRNLTNYPKVFAIE